MLGFFFPSFINVFWWSNKNAFPLEGQRRLPRVCASKQRGAPACAALCLAAVLLPFQRETQTASEALPGKIHISLQSAVAALREPAAIRREPNVAPR